MDPEPGDDLALPDRSYLNTAVAQRLLKDPETQALACLVAASCLIGDDIFDEEDEQPFSSQELEWLFEHSRFMPHRECLNRITGLMFARSGDEFFEDPDHFLKLTSAIVEGDPLAYEEDEEDPTLADLYWAVYQVGLTIEDEEEDWDQFSPRVMRVFERISEEQADDLEGLAQEIEETGGDPEDLKPYMDHVLVFRRAGLAKDLRDLGCKPEWLASLDPELAEALVMLED